MYFYTTFCGLFPVKTAAIFSVASIIDAVSNPVMGFISDNFHRTRLGRKFGRRRFFIMMGIPLMLVYPMLWVDGLGFWYYLSTYVLFELAYTSVMVPYEALASEMTRDFGARSRLTGWKDMFGKDSPLFSSTFRVKTFRHHLGMYLGGFSAEWLFTSAYSQPVAAQHAIFYVLVVGTIVLAIIGMMASVVMKLDIDSHKKLIAEIDRLKNGGSMKSAKLEARKVFEQLTGFSYDRCWGNNNVGFRNKPVAPKTHTPSM
nr:MFS transporter [Paenibacillus polymyxa]